MLYLTYRDGLNSPTQPLLVSPPQAARYIRAVKGGHEFHLRRGEDYLEISLSRISTYLASDAVVRIDAFFAR